MDYSSPSSWEDIDNEYRSVILAEAGAGKTWEMRARAKYVGTKGDYAFFIRIEDIENDFERQRSASGRVQCPACVTVVAT